MFLTIAEAYTSKGSLGPMTAGPLEIMAKEVCDCACSVTTNSGHEHLVKKTITNSVLVDSLKEGG